MVIHGGNAVVSPAAAFFGACRIREPTAILPPNTFFMNERDPNGLRFRNVAAQYGVLDTAWGWGTAFVDMNLDGVSDLYAVQGMRAFVGDDSEHLAKATSTLFLGDAAGTGFTVAKDTGCDQAGDDR